VGKLYLYLTAAAPTTTSIAAATTTTTTTTGHNADSLLQLNLISGTLICHTSSFQPSAL
jgi:hypothetical protein